MQGLRSEEQTCGFENGMADSPLLGRWKNQSDSQGTKYGSDDTEISCTIENFHKFKSFFLEFMKISREYFLPPERHRFGLISERSLLPFVDVGNPETWLLVVQFSGCSNCSVIVHEGDDLRSILQTHHTLIKEVLLPIYYGMSNAVYFLIHVAYSSGALYSIWYVVSHVKILH